MANECQCCGKKISISKVFCSKDCKEEFFQLSVISVPKQFVKNYISFVMKTKNMKRLQIFQKDMVGKQNMF